MIDDLWLAIKWLVIYDSWWSVDDWEFVINDWGLLIDICKLVYDCWLMVKDWLLLITWFLLFQPLKFGNQATSKSANLIDFSSGAMQTFLIILGSLLCLLIVAGFIREKYFLNKNINNNTSNLLWFIIIIIIYWYYYNYRRYSIKPPPLINFWQIRPPCEPQPPPLNKFPWSYFFGLVKCEFSG